MWEVPMSPEGARRKRTGREKLCYLAPGEDGGARKTQDWSSYYNVEKVKKTRREDREGREKVNPRKAAVTHSLLHEEIGKNVSSNGTWITVTKQLGAAS